MKHIGSVAQGSTFNVEYSLNQYTN